MYSKYCIIEFIEQFFLFFFFSKCSLYKDLSLVAPKVSFVVNITYKKLPILQNHVVIFPVNTPVNPFQSTMEGWLECRLVYWLECWLEYWSEYWLECLLDSWLERIDWGAAWSVEYSIDWIVERSVDRNIGWSTD